MRWTIKQVAEAVGSAAWPEADAMARLAGVSIDSRTVCAGELFIAIHGPRHDGHDHVASALDRGAVAAMVAEAQLSRYPGWMQSRCIPVADTLVALHQLARAVRKEWGKKIAGVTGSVGKTTTKEILAALLGARLRVLKSEGNFNNAYGLPLTLFRLEETHDAAVLEMGMSEPGELKQLASISSPDVAIVTRVSPAHLSNFISLEEIAWAKRELVEGLNGANSLAVLNADDPRVAAMASRAPGKVISYGVENPANFRAEEIEDRGALGSAFTLVAEGKRTRLELALPGRHVIANAVACIAAASAWNIGAAEAQSVFPTLRSAAMRGELLKFSNGIALINDSYNSSPAALQAMTELVVATPGYQRRILAIGEMLELGRTSAELHREAGKFAAKTGKIDWIVAVQGDAAEFIEGAVAAGFPRAKTKSVPSSADAAHFLADFLAPGDLLLVKGSRGVKMERVIEALLARYDAASVPASPGAAH
ncbi:MAG TPA: UDP-N-acetylmuramoyl-tripeptide--D-alanyl-D-alanine ligase [Candidatus Dormibacteraeota bacterium]|nr:UDP-N-acetylmuramoyl-tripeptide--D-alanyl-D-alanine ligase [Candidatus Dormibacteraeota bacterium]